MVKCIERAESHCRSYPRCDGCGAYREPTNADRIRAMSDEELSVWLIRLHTICECCAVLEECETMQSDVVCRQHIEDWLKQPVKDGEDDGR